MAIDYKDINEDVIATENFSPNRVRFSKTTNINIREKGKALTQVIKAITEEKTESDTENKVMSGLSKLAAIVLKVPEKSQITKVEDSKPIQLNPSMFGTFKKHSDEEIEQAEETSSLESYEEIEEKMDDSVGDVTLDNTKEETLGSLDDAIPEENTDSIDNDVPDFNFEVPEAESNDEVKIEEPVDDNIDQFASLFGNPVEEPVVEEQVVSVPSEDYEAVVPTEQTEENANITSETDMVNSTENDQNLTLNDILDGSVSLNKIELYIENNKQRMQRCSDSTAAAAVEIKKEEARRLELLDELREVTDSINNYNQIIKNNDLEMENISGENQALNTYFKIAQQQAMEDANKWGNLIDNTQEQARRR